MIEPVTNEHLFNTPLEYALRALIVLAEISPASCDLHRLKIYDYLLIHSNDVANGPPSLHPPTPFRSGELLVRQALVEKGLRLLISKGLVEQAFGQYGIQYRATDLASPFLRYFESKYAVRATEAARWLVIEFGEMPDMQLQAFVNAQLGRWGAEFAGDFTSEDDVKW